MGTSDETRRAGAGWPDKGTESQTCPSCGATVFYPAHGPYGEGDFCPHCGARMDVREPGTGAAEWQKAYPSKHRVNPDDLDRQG